MKSSIRPSPQDPDVIAYDNTSATAPMVALSEPWRPTYRRLNRQKAAATRTRAVRKRK